MNLTKMRVFYVCALLIFLYSLACRSPEINANKFTKEGKDLSEGPMDAGSYSSAIIEFWNRKQWPGQAESWKIEDKEKIRQNSEPITDSIR